MGKKGEELVVPETDDHVCPAAHSSLYSAMRKKQTEGRVMWVCRHAPDDLGRDSGFIAAYSVLVDSQANS